LPLDGDRLHTYPFSGSLNEIPKQRNRNIVPGTNSQPSAASEVICSVLLAEDSEDDAFFFQRALKKTALPCAFRRVANGKQAIQIIQDAIAGVAGASLPNFLFLDLKMPVKSGFDVLDWLKTQPVNAMKVVVLSGSNDHADRLRVSAAGVSEYLVKPITQADLKALLQAPPEQPSHQKEAR
jgi:CheY-like chemotaxis protein